MKKRVQVYLNDEAWSTVDALIKDANEGFEGGSINCSDAINEMVLTSKVDVKLLQLKHTNLKKSLRVLASKQDLDLDFAIKHLMDLRARNAKKKSANHSEEVLS